MDARKFAYVCVGILCLAVAYHLGAARTEAQGTGTFVGLAGPVARGGYVTGLVAVTASGDLYAFDGSAEPGALNAVFLGNLLSGPVTTDLPSFGSAKAKHR